jgi:hypothetical protein
MPLSDEFYSQWDHIISTVDMTDVPIECINKIILRLHGGRQRTINLNRLREQGLDASGIESVLDSKLQEYEEQIRDLEFMVDVVAVAEIVQPETDKLLSNLK